MKSQKMEAVIKISRKIIAEQWSLQSINNAMKIQIRKNGQGIR